MNETENISKISIIIPVYNVEKYINHCLTSVVSQTYSDLEIIIVDDGSTDKSGLICDTFANIDKRIKVIHKENGGLSSARNAGLDVCSGDYIAFVDSDDFLHPQFIEYLLNSCEKNNCDISVCDYISVEKDIDYLKINNMDEICILSSKDAIKELSTDGYLKLIVCWNKLYKSKLFDYLRFPDKKIHEDEFTTHVLLFNANKIAVSNQYLYYYRRNADSITGRGYSEKNFDKIEGLLSRAIFLKEKGFHDELKHTLKKINNSIKKAELFCLKNNDNNLQLRLNIYKNEFDVFEFREEKKVNSKKEYIIDKKSLDYKIVIYGAGNIGKAIYNTINKENLIGWVDNRWFYMRDMDYKINPINEVLNMNYDYIVLTQKSSAVKKQIESQLVSWGIPLEKIRCVVEKNNIISI